MTEMVRSVGPCGAGERVLVILMACLGATIPGWALDGGNSVFVTAPTGVSNGWKTFELLSGDDPLRGRTEEGFAWTTQHDDWDGLGAYRHDNSTLRVFVNHEAGSNSTFSRVDLDLDNLRTWIANGIPNNTNTNQVGPPGPVVTAISRGWLSVGSGTAPLNNPCSGNVWEADTFGPGRGFGDRLYLLGEETFNSSGQFWVMDVSTRTIYECPSLGGGSWESAAIIDTGRTDTVAVLLAEDNGASLSGTAPLRLYVGLKNPAGGFLERNGLSGGTVYHWDPAARGTNGTMGGLFAAGNGTTVSGTWVLDRAGAALFSKLEDVHTNMQAGSAGYGVEAVFASQNQAVFTVDFSAVDFVAGGLGTARDSEVAVLFQAGTQAGANSFGAMDNLVWSADGKVYVNEDDGEGDIWMIDVTSLRASYAARDFIPSAAQVVNILDADFVSESSGITDISAHVGYEPGGVFLTAGQSSELSTNQLALLVAPTANRVAHSLVYTAGDGGTVVGAADQSVEAGSDGMTVTAWSEAGTCFTGWSDGVLSPRRTDLGVWSDLSVTANFAPSRCYERWIAGFPSLVGTDALPLADPEGDGVSNLEEFGSNLDPTLHDAVVLAAGSGTAGLPLIEVRNVSGSARLVVEYVRRLGAGDLADVPLFGGDLSDPGGWETGGTETVVPIDGYFERVIREDRVPVGAQARRFALFRFDLLAP